MTGTIIHPAANFCPRRYDPEHGSVYTTGISVGSTAIYTCDYGYQVMGSDTLTCNNYGEWDTDPPICSKFHFSSIIA